MNQRRPRGDSLQAASFNRLACLERHWGWANNAMTGFEQERSSSWDDDEGSRSDQLLGAYYQWCALLCGLAEAALSRALVQATELESLRADLEECLPRLRECRRLLTVIPDSREQYPRVVDLRRGDESMQQLRRVHFALGQALQEAQASRELALLEVSER